MKPRIILIAALLICSVAAGGSYYWLTRPEHPAPQLAVTSLDALPQPLPLPYDEGADADAQLDAAMQSARRSGRKLVVDLGGNWCADCRVMAGILELPDLRRYLDRHFVLVSIDVGRFDRNGQILHRFGLTSLHGVPAILIVDPASGQLLNEDRLFAWSDGQTMTPQAVADWFARWA